MRTMIALILCGACGGGGSSGVDSAVVDVSTAVDAPVDGRQPSCAASTFTTSTLMGALNGATNDTYLRLSPDELTAYFARLETDYRVFFATRATTTAAFSTPMLLPITGNSTLETTSPTVTADGLTLYFTSARTGTMGGRDIWRATRATTAVNFGTITAMTALNSIASENDVFVLPDHSALYFSSARGDAVFRIYRAERQGTDFGPAQEVFSDAPASVNRIVIAPNELTMLYQNGGDLRLSTRASTGIAWLPGAAIAAIDSVDADHPSWISSDLCRMYFHTNRSGNYQLRLAERTAQ